MLLIAHETQKSLEYHLLFPTDLLGKPFGYSLILVLSRAMLLLT